MAPVVLTPTLVVCGRDSTVRVVGSEQQKNNAHMKSLLSYDVANTCFRTRDVTSLSPRRRQERTCLNGMVGFSLSAKLKFSAIGNVASLVARV